MTLSNLFIFLLPYPTINKTKEIWQSMTFPPPQPGGTNLSAVEGDRNKKLESRDTKKARPYQCFFQLLSLRRVSVGPKHEPV